MCIVHVLYTGYNIIYVLYNKCVSSGIYPVFDGSKIMYTNKRIENLDKVVSKSLRMIINFLWIIQLTN